MGSAFLAHRDKETGSLEIDKKADFIILDKNLWNLKATEIHKAKVLTTVIDGRVVYNKYDLYNF